MKGLDTYTKESNIYKYNAKKNKNAAFRAELSNEIVTYGNNSTIFNRILKTLNNLFKAKEPTPQRWLEVAE